MGKHALLEPKVTTVFICLDCPRRTEVALHADIHRLGNPTHTMIEEKA